MNNNNYQIITMINDYIFKENDAYYLIENKFDFSDYLKRVKDFLIKQIKKIKKEEKNTDIGKVRFYLDRLDDTNLYLNKSKKENTNKKYFIYLKDLEKLLKNLNNLGDVKIHYKIRYKKENTSDFVEKIVNYEELKNTIYLKEDKDK